MSPKERELVEEFLRNNKEHIPKSKKSETLEEAFELALGFREEKPDDEPEGYWI